MTISNIKNQWFFIVVLLFFAACPHVEAQNDINSVRLLEDLKTLSSDEMEGRAVGTEGNRKAREFLISRFKEAGAEAINNRYDFPFVFSGREGVEVNGTNVIGKITGMTDNQIVISAHYDHLGIRNGEIYNGADDDASGSAALLQLIAYFKKHKPNHTLIFAAFDAEEAGLRGSRHFVETYPDIAKVKLNINMDMISVNFENELYAAGTHYYPELKPVLETVETGAVKLLFGHDVPNGDEDDWTFASDHGPFHSAGIPFVYFGVEDHPYYHKPTDEFSIVPQEFYVAAVQVVLNTVRAFDAD